MIFIGEALAGNDAIDQLKNFNKSLMDLGGREIDGIILSKFDTVDDKGILFIGINYTYIIIIY